MAMPAFSWGPNGHKATPSSVKKQAEIAAALAARSGAPQNLGEGLNRVGEALLANSYSSKAAAGEEEGAAARKAVLDALMANPDPSMTDIAGAMGNEWVASDPGSQAIVQALMAQENQQTQRGFALDDRNAEWAHQDNDPLRQLQLQEAQQGLDKGSLEIDALRNPKPEFNMLTPDEAKGMGLPDGAYQRGADGKIYEVGGGGTNVNVNTGAEAPKLGSLSTDYGYVMDPVTGEVKIDPATGLPTAAAVPGSPAALEAAAAATKAGLNSGRKDVSTGIITSAAEIARNLAAKPGNTGLGGSLIANLPETDAAELRRQVGVLTANATIENLTAMRAASPTGGALGAVSDRENAMLAAAAGAIDPNASGPQFQRALDNYEKTLLQIVHGPEEGARIYAETRPQAAGDPAVYQAPNPPEGWGGDAALWQFMTPEDRALW